MKIKSKHLLSALALVAFFVIAVASGSNDKDKNASTSKSDSTSSANAGTAAKENWTYETEEDKMSNEKIFFAGTESTNKIEFKFPYNEKGGSSFSLYVRNMKKKNEILLQVSKGQFMTSILGNKVIRVKFDDEQPMDFTYSSPSDGSSNQIFISNASKFIAKLKTAKKLMMEPEFFEAGNQIVYFDVDGLKWDK